MTGGRADEEGDRGGEYAAHVEEEEKEVHVEDALLFGFSGWRSRTACADSQRRDTRMEEEVGVTVNITVLVNWIIIAALRQRPARQPRPAAAAAASGCHRECRTGGLHRDPAYRHGTPLLKVKLKISTRTIRRVEEA